MVCKGHVTWRTASTGVATKPLLCRCPLSLCMGSWDFEATRRQSRIKLTDPCCSARNQWGSGAILCNLGPNDPNAHFQFWICSKWFTAIICMIGPCWWWSIVTMINWSISCQDWRQWQVLNHLPKVLQLFVTWAVGTVTPSNGTLFRNAELYWQQLLPKICADIGIVQSWSGNLIYSRKKQDPKRDQKEMQMRPEPC